MYTKDSVIWIRRIAVYLLLLCCYHSMAIAQAVYDETLIEKFIQAMEQDIITFQAQKEEKKTSDIKAAVQYAAKPFSEIDTANLKQAALTLEKYAKEDSLVVPYWEWVQRQIDNQAVYLEYEALLYRPYDASKALEADTVLNQIVDLVSKEQRWELETLINLLKAYPEYISQLTILFSDEDYQRRIKEDWLNFDLDEVQTCSVADLFRQFLEKSQNNKLIQTVCSIPYIQMEVMRLKEGIARMSQYKKEEGEEKTNESKKQTEESGSTLLTYLVNIVDNNLLQKNERIETVYRAKEGAYE